LGWTGSGKDNLTFAKPFLEFFTLLVLRFALVFKGHFGKLITMDDNSI
jgi:hypothetical protein